jgi:predicted enzyme related to lactoylglutathione lyase
MTEPTTEAPPAAGTFCWNELMTPDTEAAGTFYAKLFGWTSETMDMGGGRVYTVWKQGEKSAGGMMKIEGPQMQGVPPHWLSYVTVDNVDAATSKAEGLGAKVCVPPTDIGNNIGRFSVITDPTGAALGLYQPAK